MDWKSNLKKVVKNKYALSAIGFLIYVLFVVDIDVFTIINRKRYINQLENEVKIRSNRIELLKEQKSYLKSLESSKSFARSRYLFKKDNEDVFVIVNSKK
jgi:cell division protein DivIC